ncbi:hypothetical protein SAMN05216370_2100 [Pseudomonas peli]|uniref:CD-NTase-associated protein 15 domain-containing protein n=1 Tax=Pseudomonas peli TaxID=592361 RepID=A0AB37ZBM3_9PSED|nr:pancortin-3 [Pseudomonas peli]NMZ69714.1 pancortin-3 [Pseudomonas peli]SCW60715.1 hypothetical protein SAMN05216370_2100 [Pseudomonas peli]
MHDYAIFGHSRASIGRWLGVVSVIFTGAASSLLFWLYQATQIEALTTAVITPAVIYFILHYLFNKYAWKLPFFSIPDIGGTWSVTGETLNEDGSTRYNWNAEIDIEQTWEKICITLKTTQSSSESYTATLGKKPGTKSGWVLHYSYTNNPESDQYHEFNSHKGYCELVFDRNLKSGVAAYFNSNGRRTFGKMSLCKEES